MACAWRSRQGGGRRRSYLWRAVLVALVLAGPAPAATSGRVVSDRHTGLALWGYDPVAYHLDGRARPGRAEHELRHAGLVWRFINAGNLAAFNDGPDVYMPAFGGYDPTFAARKAAVDGNPEVFALWEGRLLFFRDEASRERFFTDPGSAFRAAEAGWGDAASTLPN